jgi:DNA oxidative demethylase
MRGVEERPAGLLYRAEQTSSELERLLLAKFAELPMEPVVMRGVASRRRVRHFGLGFDCDSWETTETEPIPDYLLASGSVVQTDDKHPRAERASSLS